MTANSQALTMLSCRPIRPTYHNVYCAFHRI